MLGDWFSDTWKYLLMASNPITEVGYSLEQYKQWLSGAVSNPNVHSPDDLIALATSEYNSGNMTYEQFMAVIQAANDAKSKSSTIGQVVEVIKWAAIVAGLGVAAYLFVPPLKKIINLAPIPEPRKAN